LLAALVALDVNEGRPMTKTYSIEHSGMAIFEHPIWSFIGGIKIDLTSAPITPGKHRLQLMTGIGGIEVLLPRHVKFILEGGSLIGGYDVHEATGDAGAEPSEPTTVRLVVGGFIGGIDVYLR
jgi:predicted membrane protein